MTFDFSKAGKLIGSVFDTDFIDILRQVSGIPERVEVYSNIPCHISFMSADNPDPTAIDVAPVITGLKIHTAIEVDLQNNDFLVAKKCSAQREILKVYRGVCGHPQMSQGRQAVTMQMQALTGGELDNITPVPPINQSKITIQYKDINGRQIAATNIIFIDVGEETIVEKIDILNFDFVKAIWNSEEVSEPITVQDDSPKTHIIDFIYERVVDFMYFRILIDGAWTQNNGSLAFGLHLFGRIPFNIENSNTIRVASNSIFHQEMGNQYFTPGRKIKTFPDEKWGLITDIAPPTASGYTLTIQPYTPISPERDAPIAEWYDV